MNKNKLLVKTLSGTLCAAMLMTNVTPTYALTTNEQSTSNVDETKETEVLYNKSASYFVTIPKNITLDSNKESSYSVKVDGDIASDQEVYVSPIDSIGSKDGFNFYMKDQSTKHPKADVVADVTQNKFYWDYEDAADAYTETDNSISAPDLSSGEWKGTFDFEINMHRISNEKGLTLSTDGDVTMGLDDTLQVNAYLDGTPVTDEVSWSSSNSSISVEKGLLKTSASAEVGDSSTITVVADTKEQLASVEKALSNVGIMTAHADDTLTASFKVTIVDIELSAYDLYIKPGESATLNATILPLGTEGTVNWTRTAVSGLNLKKNGNSVEIFIASDMEVGKTYQVVASFGDFSKVCTIHIGESAHKHTYTSRVTKEPTCTEAGETTFTCVDGDDSYTQVIQPLGHKYGEVAYTWSDDKSTCTAKRVCANDASHIETETVKTTSVITKAATCDEAGTKTYTATFENSAFAKQTSTSSIPATGHKYNEGVVTKAPTCTEKGVKTFTCVDGDHSYTEEIPATGHKYGEATYTWSSDKSTCTAKRVCANDASHIETETVNVTSTITKNATCTTTGTKTYTATFKNGAFANQTTTSTIPATGHKYGKVTYTWSSDKSTCTAKRVCSIDGHVETETINSTSTITKNATCTEAGTKTYTVTFKNGGFTKQTSTITIPATGHKYGTPTYTWSSDKSTCTAKRVCANNASHIETETVNVTSAITKEATCTETGTKVYTATFKNGAFAKQTNTVTIPALGHNFSTDYIIDKEPTHTEDGSKSQHCTRCGAKQNIITISATGHTYNNGVITKNPTCTEKGLKTYTCIGGDHSYTEEIPATGHNYGAPTYTWSSDKSTCTAKRVCANDASHIETETVKATSTITKAATCTEAGEARNSVTFKNSAFASQTKIVTIPAKGHNYVNNKCTICGEKDRSNVEVAPENALEDWEYNIDSATNTIELTKYIGTNPDVVVYGKYSLNGITYDAQLYTLYRGGPFRQNEKIKTITIKDGVTANTCEYLFYWCDNLETVDVSGLDTADVTDMTYMFGISSKLNSIIGLNKLDTSNVTDMTRMFENCQKLTQIDLSNFNTSNLQHMEGMFNGCSLLASLDLSSFNTKNVKYMSWLFDGDTKLKTIYVGDNWIVNDDTDTQLMFQNCGTYDLIHKGHENEDVNPEIGTQYDLANNWSYSIHDATMTIDLDRYKGSDTNLVVYGKYKCNGKIYKTILSSVGYSSSSIKSIVIKNGVTGYNNDCNNMFKDCSNVEKIDLSGLDTSRATSMYRMFYGCNNLKTIDLSGLDTSKVTNMSQMFSGCSSLTTIKFGDFDTSNVTDMSYMFYNCSALTTLDLRKFDTSKVTNMIQMFCDSNKLTLLDLSSFNTKNVTNMSAMFYGTSSLKTVYVGDNWAIGSKTNADNMFGYSGTSSVTHK